MLTKKKLRMNPKHLLFLFNEKTYQEEIVTLYGGAGSGKSYAVAQYLFIILNHVIDPIKILITRKTNPSLTITTYRLFKEILDNYGLDYEEQKMLQTFKFANGSEVLFRGLDDPEKIKSAEFNVVWMEEATEFTEEDFIQLKLRLRAPQARIKKLLPARQVNKLYLRKHGITTLTNKIILTFNPVSSKSWVYKNVISKNVGRIMHVNYVDNKWLDKEYINLLESLKEENEEMYKIYTLGEWVEPSHLIYTNWVVNDDIPENFDEIIYGVDFGYNNPTAVLKIGIKDKVIYIIDEIYQTKMTNADLIEKLKDFIKPAYAPLYCDSAEPNRIEELYRAGFNAHSSEKSVKDGIDFIKRHKIVVSSKCVNTIKELESYSWKQDKNGNILDEPVKFMDHTCDALRYAVYTHFGKQQKTNIILV